MAERRRGHREGSYYQLPSGNWRAQVSLDGKRLSKSFSTRQQAIAWIKEINTQIERGLSFEGSRVTLAEFVAYYMRATDQAHRAETRRREEQVFRLYVLPPLGHYRLKDLRPEHIQNLYNSMLAEGKSVHQVHYAHVVLRQALNMAQKLGLVTSAATSRVLLPQKPHKEMRVLDEGEVARLLEAARETRFESLLYLAVTTGMRTGELLGLKWDDIDWDAKTLRVERQVTANRREFTDTKTRYARRTISLGDRSVEMLRTQRQRLVLERQFAKDRWKEYGLVFPSTIGTPLTHMSLWKSFKKILRSANLPDIRLHDLRHTSATLMLSHGVPLVVASRRLGHSKASITLDVYGHLLPSLQQQAADVMDDLVK